MFNDILTDLLEINGISQAELSRATQIPTTTISGWLKQGKSPDYYALQKLAQYFNIPIENLYDSKEFDYNGLENEAAEIIQKKDPEQLILKLFRALPKNKQKEILKKIIQEI